MSSINEAIFRGRMRRNDPPPTFDALNRSSIPLTTQFLARKAVEAVLAGGYTKCEPEIQETPAPEQAAPERNQFVRDAALWACILALAGVIGLAATSLLPSHAVQARTAARREALSTAAAAEESKEADAAPARAAVEAEAPAPRVVATAAIKLKPAEAPQPAEIPMQRVRLTLPAAPVAAATAAVTTAARVSRDVVHPVSKPAGLIAAIPDDQPVRVAAASGAATVRTPVSASARAAVEEVLYEGEPAAAAGKTITTAMREQDDEEGAAPAARQEQASTAETSGKPRVEGIFYDKVRPMALINGRIVEIGKQVGEYKVAEIRPGVVVLARGEERLELRP